MLALAIFDRFGSSMSGAGDNVEAPHFLPASKHSQTETHDGDDAKAASDLLAKAESAEDVKLAVANLRPFQIYIRPPLSPYSRDS